MKKTLFIFASAMTTLSMAQINNSQGFEIDNGNFTNVSFFRSKTTPVCEGSYALIRNFWTGGTTGSTTFSSNNSNGNSINVSFKYRTFQFANQSTKPVKGQMLIQYSIDNGSTFVDLGNYNLNNITTCTALEYTIPANAVPANASFKLKVSGLQSGDGDFYLILDDFKISQGTLAVSDVKTSSLKAYPSPAKNQLFISNSENITSAKIADFSGRIISDARLKNNAVQVSNLKTGSYILIITTRDGVTEHLKFIKE